MARFVYRLRAALADAQQHEDTALRALAHATRASARAAAELQRLHAAQTRASRQRSTLSVLRLYEDAVAAQQRRVDARRVEAAQAREALAPLRQRREALERHEERERSAHAFAATLRESGDLDEENSAKTRLA